MAQATQSTDEWESKHKCLESTQSLDVHHGTKWSEDRAGVAERKGESEEVHKWRKPRSLPT